MYPELNLPPVILRIKDQYVWDILRKKYVKLTPEEWVRQHVVHYLIHHLLYPAARMTTEYTVNYNGMKKRCDIVAFSALMNPLVIVECKAPDVSINQNTFYQIAKYAASLKAQLLILTNGKEHYCAKIDSEKKEINLLNEIPIFTELTD